VSLVFLLGGARSGKSALAVRIAAATDAPVVFVATAEPLDDEMSERIESHRAERPAQWQTLEVRANLAGAIQSIEEDAVVVVDCLSLWVANVLDSDTPIEEEARLVAQRCAARPAAAIVVSNEVGFGLVPMNALGRRYRDVLGRTNAIFAATADRALLVVAGRAVPLPAIDDVLNV
jgi:adenosyl cobinamide kinase/adenosyl cobinamide phosphate guanylyltransferase